MQRLHTVAALALVASIPKCMRRRFAAVSGQGTYRSLARRLLRHLGPSTVEGKPQALGGKGPVNCSSAPGSCGSRIGLITSSWGMVRMDHDMASGRQTACLRPRPLGSQPPLQSLPSHRELDPWPSHQTNLGRSSN